MTLATLPAELLANVVKHLPTFEVERLAPTFNWRIYSSYLPLLQNRIAAKRLARAMRERFGEDHDSYKEYGLEAKYGPYVAARPPKLDYVDLNGDLSWLQRPEEDAYYNSVRWQDHNERMSAKEAESLARQAEHCGVVLPDAFLRFTKGTDLILFARSKGTGKIRFESALWKVPANLGKEAGGYVMSFWGAMNNHWLMYLDPGPEKGHCILVSTRHTQSHPRSGVPHGWGTIRLQGQSDRYSCRPREWDVSEGKSEFWIALAAASFEEFLARVYFENWVMYSLVAKGQLVSRRQEEYVANVYTACRLPSQNSITSI